MDEIKYIDTTSGMFYSQEKGVQRDGYIDGVYIPYCIITKLLFGRYKIEYQDEYSYKEYKLIVYPTGIKTICYQQKIPQ